MTMRESLELRKRIEAKGEQLNYHRRIAFLNKMKRKGLISVEEFLKQAERSLRAFAA